MPEQYSAWLRRQLAGNTAYLKVSGAPKEKKREAGVSNIPLGVHRLHLGSTSPEFCPSTAEPLSRARPPVHGLGVLSSLNCVDIVNLPVTSQEVTG